MHDAQTLTFYAEQARSYAARYSGATGRDLDRFLALLQSAAHILELGCGGGQDAVEMLARGFDVSPTDGSPQMAAEAARRLGRPVRTMLFEELDETEVYDGVWASACLLHVSLGDLPNLLGRVHRALRPDGWFYASFKAGHGAGRDQFGRFYSYLTEVELAAAYRAAAEWQTVRTERQCSSGYDGQPTDWLAVTAQA